MCKFKRSSLTPENKRASIWYHCFVDQTQFVGAVFTTSHCEADRVTRHTHTTCTTGDRTTVCCLSEKQIMFARYSSDHAKITMCLVVVPDQAGILAPGSRLPLFYVITAL